MTTETAARHAESAPAVRRRWPIYLAAGLVLSLIAAAGYILWFTAVLGVKHVSVTGAGDDLAAEVRGALAVPEGTPLIKVDLRAAELRVAEVPEVALVHITRRWPDTLAVDVQARTPVAVTSANGQLWLLDSGGDPYLRVPGAPAGLTVVELATPGPKDPATGAALTVIGSMTADFRKTVAKVQAPSAFDVTVVLQDHRVVHWGGADHGARKMQILPALLSQQGQTYDISDPDLASVGG